jgi:hypothetical protein
LTRSWRWLPPINTASGCENAMAADSDEAARVYRALSAHRSNLMAPTILI